MDEKSESLKIRFFGEAEEYLSRSRELLADLGDDSVTEGDVHELFRCIHSIKSEAAYLRFEEVTEVSHALEEKLSAFRSGGADAVELPKARELLDVLERTVRTAKAREAVAGPSSVPGFNLFEKKLIDEARRHGEHLYRVCCDLDPETSMKQARAYLILSNLEQIANVIRMEPSIHHSDDEAFGSLAVYLTASADESEIFKALDIDQVLRSTVERMDFLFLDADASTDLEIQPVFPLEPQSLYRLGSRKLKSLTAYADELKITLKEVYLDLSKEPKASPGIRDKVTRLSHLATWLFEELRQTRATELADEFGRLEELAKDLAAQLNKRIRFESSGGAIEIDRRDLLSLSDPLTHLVRNAVDHGVESPDQREAGGKAAEACISIVASEDAEYLSIVVSDDGGGIDEAAIRARFKELGEDGDGDLMALLSRPGFTTLDEATSVSGRGVGLDLVVQRVVSMGGKVRLDLRRGLGASFEIILPRGLSYSQLLFFRLREKLYAVSNETVADVKKITKGDLKRSQSGRIFCLGTPAFAGESSATVDGSKSYGSYAIQTTYLGKNACFLADDVLFEHDVQKELLEHDGSEQKKRFAVRFGSGKREFFYLSPTLIDTSET